MTLSNIFRIWLLVTRRSILKRNMAKHSKTARKFKVREVLQQARRAADAKDQFELFRHIRVLAPKHSTRDCNCVMMQAIFSVHQTQLISLLNLLKTFIDLLPHLKSTKQWI